MIVDLDTRRPITRPAHADTWRLIEKRLSKSEIDGIVEAIHAKIGEDDEIKVAGWMPGSDWTGTPFQIIYEKAGHHSFELAALMFGSLAWEAFIRHPDEWLTTKTTFSGRDIENRVYFRRRH